MTYPDGKQVWYTYDTMNRMASARGLDGEVTAYTYDKAGRRIQTGDPASASSLTTEYSYDSVGNLLEQATSGASNIAFRYSYNKNGYITDEKRTENGKTAESAYTYDPLGQLIYGEYVDASITVDAENVPVKTVSVLGHEAAMLVKKEIITIY